MFICMIHGIGRAEGCVSCYMAQVYNERYGNGLPPPGVIADNSALFSSCTLCQGCDQCLEHQGCICEPFDQDTWSTEFTEPDVDFLLEYGIEPVTTAKGGE